MKRLTLLLAVTLAACSEIHVVKPDGTTIDAKAYGNTAASYQEAPPPTGAKFGAEKFAAEAPPVKPDVQPGAAIAQGNNDWTTLALSVVALAGLIATALV